MSDDYQEDWDDLDDKEILMGILTELQQIRLLLQGAENVNEGGSEPMYECTKCETQVREKERKDHAINAHKAPPDMVDTLFTKVD